MPPDGKRRCVRKSNVGDGADATHVAAARRGNQVRNRNSSADSVNTDMTVDRNTADAEVSRLAR